VRAARVPAAIRDEIVRLRGERLSYFQIAQVTGVSATTVGRLCQGLEADLVRRAKAALAREVALARKERSTSPLFHPEDWR
jgi:DNA-binding MurR/RpiR family transcriptional regulator